MNKSLKTVSTDQAPAAIGPYSQAIIYNGLLYTSGQIPICPESGEISVTDIEAQTRQVMENIRAILDEAGTDFGHVLKTTCFLAEMTDFDKFNSIYETYFVSRPARSCVAVKTLPKNVLCEVELIAAV